MHTVVSKFEEGHVFTNRFLFLSKAADGNSSLSGLSALLGSQYISYNSSEDLIRTETAHFLFVTLWF